MNYIDKCLKRQCKYPLCGEQSCLYIDICKNPQVTCIYYGLNFIHKCENSYLCLVKSL